jgi:hypothetical protein
MARAVNDMLRTMIDDAKSRGNHGYQPNGVAVFECLDSPGSSIIFIYTFDPLPIQQAFWQGIYGGRNHTHLLNVSNIILSQLVSK